MPGYIHHIEWCVRDLEGLSDQLINQFGFRLISGRKNQIETGLNKFCVRQKVLKSGYTVFILTEKQKVDNDDGSSSNSVANVNENNHESHPNCNGHSIKSVQTDSIYPVLTCCQTSHSIDSVFNVCLEVGDVDAVTKNILAANSHLPRTQASIIIPPSSITVKTGSGDSNISIRYSVVQSPCGNVVHTLINTKEYKSKEGLSFLPGFVDIHDNGSDDIPSLSTTHMDHVTYVCRTNQSHDILKWYKTCFGMQPFQITNSSDADALDNSLNEEEQEKKEFNMASVEIRDEVGMKMTVGEWITSWLCREEGVQFPKAADEEDNILNFKLVLAEPLEEGSDSHVQHFLDSHGGPGLQHIGLMAPNVSRTVEWMYEKGAKFRLPPPTYYQLEHKVREITAADEDLEKFRKLGLLLDSEADIDIQDRSEQRFLIQIFTKPLFFPTQNTFFLEILERRGARGFGAGNITALAKSIILQQQQEQQQQALTS